MDEFPVEYVTIRKVNIRKGEPKVLLTNYAGQYPVGKKITVYDIKRPQAGWEWARVSEPEDSSGISTWSCIKSPDTVYMMPFVKPTGDEELKEFEGRLSNLEAWSMIQGYDPHKNYKK